MQSSSKMTNAGVAFVAISILIGVIFSADMTDSSLGFSCSF
jgi:hypothetical protein